VIMMTYTFPIKKEMAIASTTLSVSPKHALAICRSINRRTWKDAKLRVDNLATQTTPLTGRWKGKYYSKAASQISKLLDAVASNARQKTIDPETSQLLISAHRGPSMYRGRRKRRFGMQLKIVHVDAILQKPSERPKKKVEKK